MPNFCRPLFIILLSLRMTLFSEKIFIFNRYISGLMPNLIKTSWTVSTVEFLWNSSLILIRILQVGNFSGKYIRWFWLQTLFWKINLEKSSSTNWILNLQKSISKLIFAGYTGSKNPVQNKLKIQFVELDFSNLIFQKSSTVQQGVRQMWVIWNWIFVIACAWATHKSSFRDRHCWQVSFFH